MKAAALLAVLVSLACASGPGGPRPDLAYVNWLPKAPTCLDGSKYGVFIRPGDPENWIINLQGGGECNTKDKCSEHLKDGLGSSNYWSSSMKVQDEPFLVYDKIHNPKFSNYTVAYIPYCSQDLWMGQRSTVNDWGMYFSGHNLLNAAIDALLSDFGLDKAKLVLFAGESAGGIGVMANVDFLREKLAPYGPLLLGVPVAGFYFPAYPYEGPGHTAMWLSNFTVGAWPATFQLYDAFVPTACWAELGSPLCMLGNVSVATIETPLFIAEAQTDQVQLLYHVPKPPFSSEAKSYVEQWSANMTHALKTALSRNPLHGAISPACFIHTSFNFQQPVVHGVSLLRALELYVELRQQGISERTIALFDECGIMCNPTCPKSQ